MSQLYFFNNLDTNTNINSSNKLYHQQNDCVVQQQQINGICIGGGGPYPLEHQKKHVKTTCPKLNGLIFSSPDPSELYGNTLKSNGNNGMFYFNDLNVSLPLSQLVYAKEQQPFHYHYIPK